MISRVRIVLFLFAVCAGLLGAGRRAEARPYKIDYNPWLCRQTGGVGAISYSGSSITANFFPIDVTCPLPSVTLLGDSAHATTMSYQFTYIGSISNCWLIKDWLGMEYVQIQQDTTKSVAGSVQWGIPTSVQLPTTNSSDSPVNLYVTCSLSAWSTLTGIEVITN
jgi:hypothetical protein